MDSVSAAITTVAGIQPSLHRHAFLCMHMRVKWILHVNQKYLGVSSCKKQRPIQPSLCISSMVLVRLLWHRATILRDR